ncbi:hypothetical protein [Methylobacter luteus]|uniref:hypothetical protein n=1 Tax=Methylobacter luteus TaxID=415 RepID=UPI0012DBE663|nr:hypothetical protein [Methylobacter luteus]
MYIFDPTRTDLALEFYRNLYGRHSADLQYLLNFMREPSKYPHFVFIETVPGEEWAIGKMQHMARACHIIGTERFSTVEQAEWHVFKLRWHALGGNTLEGIC